jgi:hypothetical protein
MQTLLYVALALTTVVLVIPENPKANIQAAK